MSTIVRNEADLDTLLDENLVTEDYALEILGLKNIADFRKFSRSFMKLSKIVKGIDDSNNEKLDKGDYTGNAKNLNDEISKKASKIVLGRMLVGDNLTVDENGRVSGNPAYTHPTGAGNNHIPAGGSIGQVLKNSGNGVATWGDMDLGNYYTKTETDEKFKNFCPFPINSLYLSLGSENPSTLWLGTTWQKQEGRFLLGSSSNYSLGATGGASTVQLAVANLPSHTHSASQSAHTHTQPTHKHSIYAYSSTTGATYHNKAGAFAYGVDTTNTKVTETNACLVAGGDTTGSSTPSISIGATGSGAAFSILPPYLVINIWKRLS